MNYCKGANHDIQPYTVLKEKETGAGPISRVYNNKENGTPKQDSET